MRGAKRLETTDVWNLMSHLVEEKMQSIAWFRQCVWLHE